MSGNENHVRDDGLPVELDRLVHHVELHRSGWWDQALRTLLLATAWLKAPITATQLVEHLHQELDGRLTRERAEQLIAVAIADGTLVDLPGGGIKASEDVSSAFSAQLESVERCEERLHMRFVEAVAEAGVDADPEKVWMDVNDMYLRPLVREAGARMYQVLTSSADVTSSVPAYEDLVKPISDRYGHEIRAALIAFLDPSDADVREFVLRMVNANFVREAAALDSSVLDGLSASRGQPQGVKIFLDTNFLFSFLQLHDNPANEAADDLMDLIDRCRSTLGIELYVLPITIDEARRVIRGVTSRLENLQPTRNMAAAARELTSTGLVAKYLEAASHSPDRLRPDDYFGPYDSGLPVILEDKGIKLYNDNLDSLRVDQGVIDDIHAMNERQANRLRGQKPYETNLHDAVLWRHCFNRRPASSDSPLDLSYWVCTLDYGLIAFDRSKSRQNHRPPVCLTPSALVQLLQFWAPRSEELDRALVGSVRQPLLFLEFDSASEKTTIEILRSLSRYENIGDLPVKTLYGVISDDALRTRLAITPNLSDEEQAEMVESAIIKEAQTLDQQLGEARAARLRAEQEAAAGASTNAELVASLRAELDRRTEDVERLVADSESMGELVASSTAELSAVSAESAAESKKLQHRIDAIEAERRRSNERSRTVLVLVSLTAVLAALTIAGESVLDEHIADWLAWVGPAVSAVCVLTLLANQIVVRNKDFGLSQRPLLGAMSKVAIWVLAAAVAGVIGDAVFAGLKDEGDTQSQSATAVEPRSSESLGGGGSGR